MINGELAQLDYNDFKYTSQQTHFLLIDRTGSHLFDFTIVFCILKLFHVEHLSLAEFVWLFCLVLTLLL